MRNSVLSGKMWVTSTQGTIPAYAEASAWKEYENVQLMSQEGVKFFVNDCVFASASPLCSKFLESIPTNAQPDDRKILIMSELSTEEIQILCTFITTGNIFGFESVESLLGDKNSLDLFALFGINLATLDIISSQSKPNPKSVSSTLAVSPENEVTQNKSGVDNLELQSRPVRKRRITSKLQDFIANKESKRTKRALSMEEDRYAASDSYEKRSQQTMKIKRQKRKEDRAFAEIEDVPQECVDLGDHLEKFPKRPKNAYQLWFKGPWAKIKEDQPEKLFSVIRQETTKQLGAEWKLLDKEDKQPFIKEAENLRSKHMKVHPDLYRNGKFILQNKSWKRTKEVRGKEVVNLDEDSLSFAMSDPLEVETSDPNPIDSAECDIDPILVESIDPIHSDEIEIEAGGTDSFKTVDSAEICAQIPADFVDLDHNYAIQAAGCQEQLELSDPIGQHVEVLLAAENTLPDSVESIKIEEWTGAQITSELSPKGKKLKMSCFSAQ